MARKKTDAPVSVKKSIFDKIAPKKLMAAGAVAAIVGLVFTCVSLGERKTLIGAVEHFTDRCVYIDDGVYSSDYDGRSVIVAGELTYSEAGASDAVLGVSADSAILYRISEMYQWTLEDGKPVGVWSEELLTSPDGEHENPSSYPSNLKSAYYIAEAVKLGDFNISADQLLLLEQKTPVSSLPEVDVRGFKTADEYITNSEDLASPEIGDVRIRYEYATADKATFIGKQRSYAIYSYANFEDVPFFLSIEGILTRSEGLSAVRASVDFPLLWLFILSSVVSLVGGYVFFRSLCKHKEYKPSLEKLGKKLAKLTCGKVIAIHSAAFSFLLYALVLGTVWASVYEIGIAFAIVFTLMWLGVLIPDMIINMPKRAANEAEYVPILIKREDETEKKKRK